MKAEAALDLAVAGDWALIDVRSEREFARGAVPGFINLPILDDRERHLVGKTYKEVGQSEAVALGHELVASHRTSRIQSWLQQVVNARTRRGLVTCWRGGMRSEIASGWLREHGAAIERVEGGYQAMRRVVTSALATPPTLVVLAGLTGSGKTQLLHDLPPGIAVDLEGLAKHRGSSFGRRRDAAQPSQATFENALALALWRRTRPLLVEDESAAIGRLMVPRALRNGIAAAPVVFLECDPEARARRIYEEYVVEPLAGQSSPAALAESLKGSVTAIARRLGGESASRVKAAIDAALREAPSAYERHRAWILELLLSYYDKAYNHAFERSRRDVVFRGDYEECRRWILSRFA